MTSKVARGGVSADFRRGAEAAADVADNYNASSTHPHRLGDCILGKLNLRAGKPRRNRATSADDAMICGIAVALADVHRLVLSGNDSAGVCSVASSAGITVASMKAAGVSAYDISELRKAGVR